MTDSQWDIIQDMIPRAKPGGPPRSLDMRQVVNAIQYVVGGGIQWWMLPKEYPAWQSVYGYFRHWQQDHTWQRIHDTLRAAVRRRAGRHSQPTVGCLDSQSAKTTAVRGSRGFDKAKLINGPSATYWLIPSACSWRSPSRSLRRGIVTAHGSCFPD